MIEDWIEKPSRFYTYTDTAHKKVKIYNSNNFTVNWILLKWSFVGDVNTCHEDSIPF